MLKKLCRVILFAFAAGCAAPAPTTAPPTAAPLAAPLQPLAARPGVRIEAFGSEQLVSLAQGNLAPTLATSGAERVRVLGEFLIENRATFGAGAANRAALAFAPAVPESVFTRADGSAYVVVALYQFYRGARIVDQIQYGSYNGGALQQVRARLIDPNQLPTPPSASPEQRASADATFRKFLAGRGSTTGSIAVDDAPVLSARLGIAGYLGSYTATHADGTATRLAAIIDPTSSQVTVLYDIENDAGDAPPGVSR